MLRIFVLIIFCVLSFAPAYSQFEIDLSTYPAPLLPEDGDTLSVCQGDQVAFVAYAVNGTDTLKNVTYLWQTSDGQTETRDSAVFLWPEGGAYHVFLKLTDDDSGKSKYLQRPVRVALDAFERAESLEKQPVCKGQDINLKAWAKTDSFEYKQQGEQSLNPAYFLSSISFAKTLYFTGFQEDALLTDPNDILSIGLKIEHDNVADLEIQLYCPSDSMIVLKADGGSSAQLGEPLDPAETGMGNTYTYSWNASPAYQSMAKEATTETRLPEGSYASDTALTRLIGCPLNGPWSLRVIDSKSANEGYISHWFLSFDEDLFTKDTTWSFRNSYKSGYWKTPDQILGSTFSDSADYFLVSGVATPQEYGNNPFYCYVINNFNCEVDTFMGVKAAEPEFSYTVDDQDTIAPVQFDFVSETDWAAFYEWDFMYDSTAIEEIMSDEQNPTYIYEKKGMYFILYRVYTEDRSCSDQKIDSVVINKPLPEVAAPNVLLTNGSEPYNRFRIVHDPSGNATESKDDEGQGGNTNGFSGGSETPKPLADVFEKLTCTIYDRHGRVICRLKSPEEAAEGWDGSTNNNGGRLVAPGVYFWVAKFKDKDGKRHDAKGQIHVFY